MLRIIIIINYAERRNAEGLAAARHSMCQMPSGRKAWKTKAKVTS